MNIFHLVNFSVFALQMPPRADLAFVMLFYQHRGINVSFGKPALFRSQIFPPLVSLCRPSYFFSFVFPSLWWRQTAAELLSDLCSKFNASLPLKHSEPRLCLQKEVEGMGEMFWALPQPRVQYITGTLFINWSIIWLLFSLLQQKAKAKSSFIQIPNTYTLHYKRVKQQIFPFFCSSNLWLITQMRTWKTSNVSGIIIQLQKGSKQVCVVKDAGRSDPTLLF